MAEATQMTLGRSAAVCGDLVEVGSHGLKVRWIFDYKRQRYQPTPIAVVFSPSSRGQLALIIYEWKDAKYIGIDADGTGAGTNEWEEEVHPAARISFYV